MTGIALATAILTSLSALLWVPVAASIGPPPVPPFAPRQTLDTRYVAPKGRTISVKAGGNLQAAINTARPGDTVTLEEGAVFRGNFTLPAKKGSDWIVIRSAAGDDALPAPGTRITPAFARSMPRLVTPNVVPVVQAAAGARRYRLMGLELTVAEGVSQLREIVAFGGSQSTLADTPSDLVLDRCYVHGLPSTHVFRGLLLNSAASVVIDSYISEIHVAGHDSQAVLGYNGPGPFRIVNNYLEAAGENIMFGGGDPHVGGLVPSDIEIRQNHLFKPLRWRRDAPDFGGIPWTIKNVLELKNAQRVVIEGNILENVWPESQGGAAIVLTPRNSGTAPWSVVQDVMIRNNVIINAVGAFGGQSVDTGHPTRPMRRIAVVNNLWLDASQTFFTIASPGTPIEDLLVDHNTAIPTRLFSYDVDATKPPALVRFQFTNNLTGFGRYGVKFPRTEGEVSRWIQGGTISHNAMVRLEGRRDQEAGTTGWPGGRRGSPYWVFDGAAAAGLNRDGSLMERSPLRGVGAAGTDIGVEFPSLLRALPRDRAQLPFDARAASPRNDR